MKTNLLKAQAIALVFQLEQERSGQTLMMFKVVKTFKTTPVILSSPPELQMAVVETVVEAYAVLGTPRGKKPTEWFRKKGIPSAGAEITRVLLGRPLPFTDDFLAGMLEKLSRVSYLSLVEFNEQLARAFGKFAAKSGISPRLRKAAKQFADALAVRNKPAAQVKFWKEECGFPRAKDRKIVAELDRVLG